MRSDHKDPLGPLVLLAQMARWGLPDHKDPLDPLDLLVLLVPMVRKGRLVMTELKDRLD